MKKLATFPESIYRRRAERALNWDSLMDGSVYQLEGGKDFKNLDAARVRAYTVAKRQGLKMRSTLALNGKDLIIQAIRPAQSAPTEPAVAVAAA